MKKKFQVVIAPEQMFFLFKWGLSIFNSLAPICQLLSTTPLSASSVCWKPLEVG